MGKGDKRSRRGKIWKGSFGNSRRRKKAAKPVIIPKAKSKPKKIVVQPELALEEAPMVESSAEVATPEVKAAKPKKAAVKKPKVEGEKKAATKKEPKKKESPKETEQPQEKEGE